MGTALVLFLVVIAAEVVSFTTAQRAVAWQGAKVTSRDQMLASTSIPTVGFGSPVYHVGEGDGSAIVTVTAATG